jgi:hypothetical protein
MYINFIKNTNFDFPITQSNQTNCSLNDEGNNLFKLCLPFKIANSLGWDIITPFSFKVTLLENDKINIETEKQYKKLFSDSIGNGILAMQLPYFIECSKNTFIHIRGPINIYKSGIYPLEALVENDWFHSYMTMNWKITEKNKEITFNNGDAICRIMPYPKQYIQDFNIEFNKKQSILDKIFRFNFLNRFSNNYATLGNCYSLGIDGINKVDNIKKIAYTKNKCPFLSKFNNE